MAFDNVGKAYDLEMDFVYVPEGHTEFEIERVHMTLKVKSDSMMAISLKSDIPVSDNDLKTVFDTISNLLFKKMRIDLRSYCDITFIEPNVTESISFSDDKIIRRDMSYHG
ncbi:MAG: hypothetical protein LBM16_02235 [Clostridiales bacterium]|jgi:hypothetical protein|nr:hypothetical protein [Clostridiales bacterium]